MPNFEFRFDLASILLASVLAVLGISTAEAGGARAGVVNQRSAGLTADSQAGGAPPIDTAGWGGKGGVKGGDVDNRR